MSVLTTCALKVTPSAASGLALLSGAGSWVDGDWVEVIASTAAGTALAGIVIQVGAVDLWSDLTATVEFGLGAEGEEVPIGACPLYGPNSGNVGPSVYRFRRAISGLPTGSRVSARYRTASSGDQEHRFSFLYYEGFDSDQGAHYLTHPMIDLPVDWPVTVTPSSTAFADSAWVELSGSLPSDTYLASVVPTRSVGGVRVEWEIGSGAASAETPLTSLGLVSSDVASSGRLSYGHFPGLYFVAKGTRVAIRMRKSGTSTTSHFVKLVAYSKVGGPFARVRAFGF